MSGTESRRNGKPAESRELDDAGVAGMGAGEVVEQAVDRHDLLGRRLGAGELVGLAVAELAIALGGLAAATVSGGSQV